MKQAKQLWLIRAGPLQHTGYVFIRTFSVNRIFILADVFKINFLCIASAPLESPQLDLQDRIKIIVCKFINTVSS